MKKFLILSSFLGFFSLNVSSQNIYILGHIQVVYIGSDGIDVICNPPYDKDCVSIITKPALPTKATVDINDKGVKQILPKVQVVGETLNSYGLPTKVYRIRKDVIKEIVKE